MIFKPKDISSQRTTHRTRDVVPNASIPFLFKRERRVVKIDMNAVKKVDKLYQDLVKSVATKRMFKALMTVEVGKLLKAAVKNGRVTKMEYNEWQKAQRVVQ